MEKYKRIAVKSLIEMVGEDWINEHKDDLCSYTSDSDQTVRVVFCLASMLPTEKETIEEKDANFQPKGSISFDVNKKDKSCKVFRDLLTNKS